MDGEVNEGVSEGVSEEANEEANEELPPSQLGTLEYWESTYDDELNNFTDHGEEGENWFGEGVTKRIISWIVGNISLEEPVLDLGCGNGTVLIRLHQQNYTQLTGIDYSVKAIELAEVVAESNGAKCIRFQSHDILSSDPLSLSDGLVAFKAIIDKGTFDAVCLNPDAKLNHVRHKYIDFVHCHLQSNGYFLLTSCNWTHDELLQHFATESHQSGSKLVFVEQIKTPTLTYGGKSGNRITSLIFQKK